MQLGECLTNNCQAPFLLSVMTKKTSHKAWATALACSWQGDDTPSVNCRFFPSTRMAAALTNLLDLAWMRKSAFRIFLYGAFPIAQLVKNLPEMQESLVLFLGWEDPLEKG